MFDDTIAAIATPPGEGGIGIVRISGRDAVAILGRVFSPAGSVSKFESHRVYYGHAVEQPGGPPIDEVVALCMLAPRSYTREDVVELHCHGGPVPLRRVLMAALRAGARPAMAGEFTLRAFLNGRIDLAQAEAVMDVVRSRTDLGLSLAMAGLGGRLSERVSAIRKDLVATLAYLEATIDFPDDDFPEEDVGGSLDRSLEALRQLLASADQGIICRQGARVAIVGRPNVGKSSLLNALLQADRAIVTEIPGTTRDTLEETADFGGVPVCLVDTAGIVESQDPVERLGVERSRRAIESADLCLLVVDRSARLLPEDREVASALAGKRAILVANKSDLPRATAPDELASLVQGAPIVETSASACSGLDALRGAVVELLVGTSAKQSDELLVSNPRHKAVLERAERYLRDAVASMEAGFPTDCVASDVRAAVDCLGEITGETATQELLEEIFSRFCVGK